MLELCGAFVFRVCLFSRRGVVRVGLFVEALCPAQLIPIFEGRPTRNFLARCRLVLCLSVWVPILGSQLSGNEQSTEEAHVQSRDHGIR